MERFSHALVRLGHFAGRIGREALRRPGDRQEQKGNHDERDSPADLACVAFERHAHALMPANGKVSRWLSPRCTAGREEGQVRATQEMPFAKAKRVSAGRFVHRVAKTMPAKTAAPTQLLCMKALKAPSRAIADQLPVVNHQGRRHGKARVVGPAQGEYHADRREQQEHEAVAAITAATSKRPRVRAEVWMPRRASSSTSTIALLGVVSEGIEDVRREEEPALERQALLDGGIRHGDAEAEGYAEECLRQRKEALGEGVERRDGERDEGKRDRQAVQKKHEAERRRGQPAPR